MISVHPIEWTMEPQNVAYHVDARESIFNDVGRDQYNITNIGTSGDYSGLFYFFDDFIPTP